MSESPARLAAWRPARAAHARGAARLLGYPEIPFTNSRRRRRGLRGRKRGKSARRYPRHRPHGLVPGPVSAQCLADFGAEVIKVERPQGGDQGRGVRSIKALPVGDWNQYFLVINRNEKSRGHRPAQAEGQQIMSGCRDADVFLSNLAPASSRLESLPGRLREINPRLVYATNTGYGRYGGASSPSFDLTVQALTGIMARLGEPGQPPIYLGMGSGDCVRRHHVGRRGSSSRSTSATRRQASGSTPRCTARSSFWRPRCSRPTSAATWRRLAAFAPQVQNPLWNIYPTRDKWVCVCEPNDDVRFAAFCRAINGADILADSRFKSAELRPNSITRR